MLKEYYTGQIYWSLVSCELGYYCNVYLIINVDQFV